jgi:hypothetical protein
MSDLDGPYTEMLAGRTVERVEHYRYGAMKVYFTDGGCVLFDSSGQPPTIFLRRVSPQPPLMAQVFRS